MPISDIARQVVRHSAVAIDRVKHPPAGVVILIYHRVGAGTASRVDVPTADFADQMAELADTGRVVTLADALQILDGTITSPHRHPVVVTFDDGTADFVDNAVPVLAEFHIPATLYAATRCIEDETPFWDDDTPPLTWSALAEAMASGVVTIGSHTHDHVLFDRIPAAEAEAQIERSVELIGSHLGVDAVDFAYPKALTPSAENRAVVERHFRSATVAGTRPNVVDEHDPFALWRTPIQDADVSEWFTRKIDGGMGFEDRLRDQLNRVRYRGAAR